MNKKQKRNLTVLTGAFTVAAGMIIAAASSASPVFAHPQSLHGGNFYADFSTIEEAQAFSESVNAKIGEESIILLKNKDETLPLRKNLDVTLLGTRSWLGRMIVGGTGSGASRGTPYSIPQSLEDVDLHVNGVVQQFYADHPRQLQVSTGMGAGQTYVDNPISEMDSVVDSFAMYDDAAIITIGRIGGEGADLYRSAQQNANGLGRLNADPTKHVLQLFDDEIDLINLAKQHFGKVIILLNTANVMEIPELEDDPGIGAILWIGQPGINGAKAIGPILVGDVNPSGRTVDIWPANFKKDPTWFNFGDNSQNNTYTPAVGETPAAWSTDFNNGHRTSLIEGSTVATGNKYTLEEEENIYLGYKWYETAASDGILDDLAIYESEKATIPEDKAGDLYYNRSTGVVYPFGYGLSYSEFEQEFVSTAAEVQAAIEAATSLEDEIDVKVKVTNSGKVDGKEVVQLYNHAPYTNGKIEKAEVSFVSFAKTSMLKPGRSEVVTLKVRMGDLASFDYNDANENGFSGWELDAGAYELRLQKNSHEEIEHLELALTAKEFKQDGSVATGLVAADSYNWFSKGDDYDTLLNIKLHGENDGVSMKLMSRTNFVSTFPTAPTAAERVYPDIVNALLTNSNQRAGTSSIAEGAEGYDAFAKYYRYTGYFNGSDDLPTDPWYRTNADIPESWTQAVVGEDGAVEGRVDGMCEVLLSQMAGYDYDDEVTILPEGHPYAGMTAKAAWDAFMNQLTYAELNALFENGGYRTPGLISIGKKYAGDKDGPASLGGTTDPFTTGCRTSGTSWICEVNIASTYNVELANKQGKCVGNESLFINSPGWYGPAMNIHRSPFSGRNFEYYSQDGVQGGIIAGYVVAGAQSKGCNVYMKHFAANDQETQRTGLGTFLSEQALREICLKPFEYATKKGNATAMMSAFNRVGAINAYANYRLCVNVLRDEWGFRGQGVTDYYSASLAKANYLQRGGCEMPLNTGHPYNAALTGTNTNQNRMTGIWDPTLRGGKGGVHDGLGTAGEDGSIPLDTIPESPTQYWTVRMSALHIAWVGANTNNNQNGVVTVDSTSRNTQTPANLFTFEAEQSVEYGANANINVALPASVTAGHSVRYEADGLPEGLSFNASTGVISGRSSAIGTYNVTVNAIIDNYILRSATLRLTIAPNATAVTGEEFSQAITLWSVGQTYSSGNTVESVQDPIFDLPEGFSVVTVSAEEATEERPAGTYIVGTFVEPGQYVISFSQQFVTINSRNRRTTRTSSFAIAVEVTGDPVGPVGPVAHGGIVSSVINDEGHLVITYEDGFVADLGLVVGADGAAGAVGPQGPQGEKGDKGDQGEKGETGAAGQNGQDGAQGPKGDTGAQGPQGEQGPAGPAGADGKDGQDAKGCGGSIAAASGIMALIAGLGLAVISIKRKRD